MKLDDLFIILAEQGCDKIFIKKLSLNDNSKNQIYLGGEDAIHFLPFKTSEIVKQKSKKKTAKEFIFRNYLNFNWVTDMGICNAPESKLIFYPQYPESRLSGFLNRCKMSPSDIIGPRLPNRFLIISFNEKGQSFGFVNFINREFKSFLKEYFPNEEDQIFFETKISLITDKTKSLYLSKEKSISEIRKVIRKIYLKGWIPSSKMTQDGVKVEYKAINAGGFTLEAELGIIPNSKAAPDYLGWEIKQHSGKPVTLFTPEPDGGFYNQNGIAEFIRRFGYPDRKGKINRFNFGGVHRVTDKTHHKLSKMKLIIHGYRDKRITHQDGHIGLQTRDGRIVATWSFSKLLQHWQKKHLKTCFIKSEKNGRCYYRYFPQIELGINSTFINFLESLYKGISFYDPSSKLFLNKKNRWETKARNQFRINEKDLHVLYKEYIRIDLGEFFENPV